MKLPTQNSSGFAFLNFSPKSRRGISPIVGTLLLVAIASIAGSSVFVYSQDAFSSSQISESPNIHFIEILGYDTRDVDRLFLHDGNEILANNCCGVADGKKNYDERIAIYIQNHSPNSVIISELSFGGNVYSFAPAPKIGEWNKPGNGHKPHPNEFIIVNYHKGGNNYQTVKDGLAEIQSGEVVTLLLDLGHTMSMNHETQIKITTINGSIFVSTLQPGQDKL